VVAERLEFLDHPTRAEVAPDAHFEPAYEDRDELEEGW
jgi:hypothetical protein